MELETIEVSLTEARIRLAEYEKSLVQDRNAEDLAIAAGYRALARGLPLISLRRTISAGGWHDNGLPRIAVAPAGAVECFARWDDGDVVFSDRDDRMVNRGALVNEHSVRVPVASAGQPARRWRTAGTMVPLIPPRHRPRPRRLRHCHLLWEVGSWTWVPPEDPALIRHIRGDLWAVLAVWDLSELERLVLAAR